MTRLSPFEADALRLAIGVAQAKLEAAPTEPGIVPIEIKCTWSSCMHGRHALDHFRSLRRVAGAIDPGRCLDCNAQVVMLPDPGSILAPVSLPEMAAKLTDGVD